MSPLGAAGARLVSWVSRVSRVSLARVRLMMRLPLRSLRAVAEAVRVCGGGGLVRRPAVFVL
jgi:hypothetical protein